MAPSPGRGPSGNVRRLFVVGYSTDHGGVVLSTRKGAKSGSYVLEVDESTLDVLEAAGRRRPGPIPASTRPGSHSELTPREIQARIRAGQSLEEVAAEAGVGVDWIERFASPVLAEQAAAINRASGMVLQTAAAGPSDRPLEASVLRNLAGRGILLDEREFQAAWSARHLTGSEWCVAFRFRSRNRDVVAEWLFDGHIGALHARNRPGEELGYVGPRPDPAADRVAAGTAEPITVVPEATEGPERPVVEPPADDPLESGPGTVTANNGPARATPIEEGGGDRQPRLPLADLPRPASPSDAGSRD